MNGKNTDKSNTISKFGSFPEDENDESEQVSVASTSNGIGGLNLNKKPVEELSIALPYNSLPTSSQPISNMGQMFSNNVTNESPLSITVEANINQSAQISATDFMKDFMSNYFDCELPNLFWTKFYNTTDKFAVFIEQDKDMKSIKKVYFRNSFVPEIIINEKPYEFKRVVKTKNELENLLKEIDKIYICTRNDDDDDDGTCTGYFKRTSVGVTECSICKFKFDMKKKEITEKAIKILQTQRKMAELKLRNANLRRKLQEIVENYELACLEEEQNNIKKMRKDGGK